VLAEIKGVAAAVVWVRSDIDEVVSLTTNRKPTHAFSYIQSLTKLLSYLLHILVNMT